MPQDSGILVILEKVPENRQQPHNNGHSETRVQVLQRNWSYFKELFISMEFTSFPKSL